MFVFIDEFQYIDQAGLFMKVMFDTMTPDVQFVVSGSSSLAITKNTEFLTGRKIDFMIRHVTLYEYLCWASDNQYDRYAQISLDDRSRLEQLNTLYAADLQAHTLSYINYGGYPEVCTSQTHDDKYRILDELVTTYIKKDVA